MKDALKSVSDVMRSGVVTISEATTLESAARVMRAHGTHGVLVVEDGPTAVAVGAVRPSGFSRDAAAV